MTKLDFNKKYSEFIEYFESELDKYLNSLTKIPNNLMESMRYSLFAGGKRIRPVLLLAVNEMLGGKKEDVIHFAIAIECIHTYSLIHDDLPALDNDDYRRGKLSNHKKFSESMAILAGDALLNLAYETVLNCKNFNEIDAKALKILANYAGVSGMIAGQVHDVFKTETNDETGITNIIVNKTAKLLTAPIVIASIKNQNKHFDELFDFGIKLGMLFQITDDIFDAIGEFNEIGKTPKKDSDKYNFVNLLGVDEAQKFNEQLYNSCKNYVKNIKNNEFLLELTDYIYFRKK